MLCKSKLNHNNDKSDTVFPELFKSPSKGIQGVQLVGIDDLERSVWGTGLMVAGLWKADEKGCHVQLSVRTGVQVFLL